MFYLLQTSINKILHENLISIYFTNYNYYNSNKILIIKILYTFFLISLFSEKNLFSNIKTIVLSSIKFSSYHIINMIKFKLLLVKVTLNILRASSAGRTLTPNAFFKQDFILFNGVPLYAHQLNKWLENLYLTSSLLLLFWAFD